MKNSAVAKISRPNTNGTLPRPRVLSLLEDARNKPIIWLSAPAGSGKTTLVTSWLDKFQLPSLWYQLDEGDADIATIFYYISLATTRATPKSRTPLPILTPEFLPNPVPFARHYFEILYSRLKKPFVLVFDDYQEVTSGSFFHEIMQTGMSTVPDGITFVIISRSAPPPVFARLRATNRMSFIGWKEIKFDIEETNNLSLNLSPHPLNNDALNVLFHWTEGWAAGIVLMLERMKTEIKTRDLDHLTREEIFHYFAGELFAKTDSLTKDFLLASALLPNMTVEEAQQITGCMQSAEILATLYRNHFFTDRLSSGNPVYQYHPLFREFLLVRGEETLPAARLLELRRNAVTVLEQSGRVELAAELMCRINDWDRLARLIGSCAQALIGQGRTQTLEGWLRSFPEEYRACSSWLLYWLGICRMPFDPGESRAWLEKAFERFTASRDTTGALLSWASIVDTFVYEWGDFSPLDRWILVLEELLAEYPSFPSPEIEARVTAGMLNALTYRQPHRADLPLWAKRVKQIILKHQSIPLQMMLGNHLIIYYLWIGDFAKSAVVIDSLRSVSGLKENDPLTQQTWHVMEAMYSWFMADGETCLQAVSDGLKSAEATGVHLQDIFLLGQGVYSGLSLGDPAAACSCLEKMSGISSPRVMDKAFYQYMASSVAWYQGDLKKAIEHGRLAVKFTGEVGCPFAQALCLTELAVTLFDDGQYEEAERQLAAGLEAGRGMNHIAYVGFLHGARFAFAQNREQQGLVLLKQGLALGAQQGYVNFPRWNDGSMSSLCARALEAGIEVDYVRALVKKRKLSPPGSTLTPESWPWPLKIYTMGRFEIVKDGAPLRFPGKVQQKPLHLLKMLIALGGKGVREEQLCDQLWPDSDGDAAHSAFTSTLSRLRQMLDVEGVIRCQDGRVTLNNRLCWVDAWDFERTINEIESLAGAQNTRNNADLIIQPASRALRHYQGHFLAGDFVHSWVLARSERLRSKFLNLILLVGGYLEKTEEWEKAATYYLRGLNVDDLAEDFYRRLIICNLQLGRSAEALAVYRRCCQTLATILGIPPSRQTQELGQSIGPKNR